MLSDSNFFRTVVYIARHDAEGALGLVVNRPGNMELEDLIEQARGKPSIRKDVIYHGGPVEGPLLALHALDNLGEPCDEHLWMTSDDDQLMLLCDRPEIPARFFTGYSGWGAGQLEAELAAGGWMVADCDNETLWGDPDDIWETAVKRQGHEVLRSLFPLAGSVDPTVN